MDEAGQAHVEPLGVLDGSATEEAVLAFAAALEASYRKEVPYLRCPLVHTGDQAPEPLRRLAERKGIVLKSFGQLQGLIDFTRYLEWQTGRLEASGRARGRDDVRHAHGPLRAP